MVVVWTRRARDSLGEIARYIARDNPAAARRWISRLIHRGELIAVAPLGGRVVPEMGRHDVREVFERSYRIVYRVADDSVRVLLVFEGHKQLHRGDIDDE